MIQIILIAIVSALIQLVLPWWSLAVVAFVVCLWRGDSAGKAFLYGFMGATLPWLLYAIVIHFQTNSAFTVRMGELLFKTANAVLPIVVTAVLGGLVGGLAGLSGYLVRRAAGSQIANPSL